MTAVDEYVSIPVDEFERLCQAERDYRELLLRVYDEQPTLALPSYSIPLLTGEQLRSRRAAKKGPGKVVSVLLILALATAVLCTGYVIGKILESLL